MRRAWIATFALAGCGGEPLPPSVLLVTIDTLRADAVGAWQAPGDPLADLRPGSVSPTPRLDALAAAGTRFAAASTVTPLTLPAHASLLTGLRPAAHGLTVNGVALPALPVATLAERLADEGYDTGACVSAAVLDRRHGLAAGFRSYDDDLAVPDGPWLPSERRGDRTVDAALSWLAEARPPFFLWVHLFDPHAPYAAPDGRQGSLEGVDVAAYRDEVSFADAQIGRLLDAVSGRDLLIVVTSDHGEGLGEHGEETHGLLLQESTVHVPLVIARLGGATGSAFPEPGAVRRDAVSLVDVAPTLLELLGLEAPTGLDGVSLVRPVPGRPLPLENRAPWVYYGLSPLAGVRQDGLKLVGAPRAEPPGWTLADLDADPRELRLRQASEHLLVGAVPEVEPDEQADAVLSREALATLGYGGAEPRTEPAGPCVDPRLATELIVALNRANTALARGEPDRARVLLQALLPRHSGVAELHYLLGQALQGLGREEEARAAFGRAIGLHPRSADLYVELGRLDLRVVQDPRRTAGAREAASERAAAAFDAALQLRPHDDDVLAQRALVDIGRGDPAAALRRVEAALAARPEHVELLDVQVRACEALGDAERARAARERLRAVAPAHPVLRN